MKKLILIAFVALFSIGVRAQNSGFGLGVVFGEPTGLSAKMWTSERTALDAAVAWSFVDYGWLYLQADFLVHNFDLISVSEGSLPVYFGVGAYVGLSSDFGLGARVPVGIAYHFEGTPVEVFAELVPGLALLPEIRLNFGGGLGARYYF
ncbi:MAG: hypothetical protein E4H10_04165 [Bacteroidia bacterium]|nr:MAG: hypothetical protein E4H10_04165 [Bacteroidia bacterium]